MGPLILHTHVEYRGERLQIKRANFTASDAGEATVVAAVSGKRIVVIAIGGGGGNEFIDLLDGSGGASILSFKTGNNGVVDGFDGTAKCETTAGNGLFVADLASAGVTLKGYVRYIEASN